MHTTRRDFLKLTATATAGFCAASAIGSTAFGATSRLGRPRSQEHDYGGLVMGIQSYSLRDRSFEKMLDAMKEDLHLHAVELFPNHLAAISKPAAIEKLKEHDVKALSYGVIGFGKDEKKNREHFELAKTFGMPNLSCDPEDNDETFTNLEKLTEEYGITVAIHPHGPGHKWGKVSALERAFKGRSNRIGICADTGHLIRQGEDPLAAIKEFKDRLHALHLKDFRKEAGDNKWTDVPAGDATLDVDGIIHYLLDNGLKAPLFIEYEGGKPVEAIQKSCARVAQAVAKAKH